MTNLSCGIDFGTSNSAIAINEEHRIQLVPVEQNSLTIPSAMFYKRRQHQPYFGKEAMQMFLAGEEGRFMRSLKRVLGTSIMNQGTMINGKPLKFQKIIGGFVQNLKEKAEAENQQSIEHVVMGRPVHFVDHNVPADDQAQLELEEIARSVGFKHVEFQFEPIAAAYAHEVGLLSEKLALIVDIGGGTSDFTVIKLSNKYITKSDRTEDILANTGVRVGGNDFDKNLSLSAFMPEFGYRSTYGDKGLEVPLKPFHEMSEWSKVNFLYTPKILMQTRQMVAQSHDRVRYQRMLSLLENETGHTLLETIEHSKIELTNSTTVTAPLEYIETGLSIDVESTVFELAIQKNLEKISAEALKCVELAGITPEAIGLVVLTGGSTEIPLVQHLFKNLFANADISEENKLSSVTIGLAHEAGRKFK
ncbi:Hsp70 family protein [Marinoscillum pacificum]|uniref:Hsp70 family protein n=1 Tax=Marinoscillum pacificum TaxID=392723 RepID=UPI002157B31F|nr:Hsp70 family protein [Marinoscillum pacificum]